LPHRLRGKLKRSKHPLEAVLILGRIGERKKTLDAVKDKMRTRGYVPILFDFERPASRDLTETIRIRALLSRFVIADISDPRSVPHELMAIVPDVAVPVQPLLLSSQPAYGMFANLLGRYDWVLSAV
jgi:hypothetical protein